MNDRSILYIVIAAYFVLLIAVGLVLRRLNRNVDDYFRGGCRATWWLSGTSAFMAIFSAWTFTGAADLAYHSGWSACVIFSGTVGALIVNAFVLAKWYRQMRVITAPEMLEQRFGPVTRQVYAWLTVVSRLFISGVQLYGVAVFVAVVFRLDLTAMIVSVGIVITITATIGGTWAVMTNDFLQGLILVFTAIAVAAVSLWQVGGFSGFVHAVQQADLTAAFTPLKPGGFGTDLGWGWVLAIFLQNVMVVTSATNASLYFKAKDGREAKRGAALHAVLMVLGTAIFFLPPMVARLLYSSEVAATGLARPAEAAYAVISMQLLPPGMVALVVVTMLAATMSTLDVGLNANAAIIVRDIVPVLRRRLGWDAVASRMELILSQIVSALLGVTIIVLACYFARAGSKGLYGIMLDLMATIALPMAVPLVMMLLVRRTPTWAALFSVSVGFACSMLGFLSENIFGAEWSYQAKVLSVLGTGSVAYAITAAFWNGVTTEQKAKIVTFYAQMQRPVDFANEVGEANDDVQQRITGIFALITGVLIGLLMIGATSFRDRLVIGGIATAIILVGLGLIRVSRRPRVRAK